MSNNDLRNLHATKPTSSSKSTSIQTNFKRARKMMKSFCQVNQIFDDKENLMLWPFIPKVGTRSNER